MRCAARRGGVVAEIGEEVAERAGDHGEHDVVDGAAERPLDRLDVGQVGVRG